MSKGFKIFLCSFAIAILGMIGMTFELDGLVGLAVVCFFMIVVGLGGFILAGVVERDS